MDPLSISVGAISIIDLTRKLGKYFKEFYEAIASFEDDVEFLLSQIQDLGSVTKSIENLYREKESGLSAHARPEFARQEGEAWQNIFKTLQLCSETIHKLQIILNAIIGKNESKVTGKRDGIRKELRKQSKDGELDRIRIKLSDHRASLSGSLGLLNLFYMQRGSQDVQRLGFQLHRDIAALQARLSLTDDDTLHDPFHLATTVASTLHLNKHFDTPRSVSPNYIGRQGYLDSLKQAFDSSQAFDGRTTIQKRFVVYGLSGSGKTEFCCKFALEHKQRFWGVFTIDGSSKINAQQSFIRIAKACGTDPNERAAKSWLSSSDRPWLLIIDNADDTNLDIQSYFPESELGFTLITTRNPSFKMHGTIGQRYYHFERLNDSEATDLLLNVAEHHEPRTPSIMQSALAIVKKLEALPLAIIHAGNAIKTKICKLADYITEYEKSWQLVRQRSRSEDEEEDNDFLRVYSTYEIIFAGLKSVKKRKYKDAVELLQIFAFLHHEQVPFCLLTAAVEHPRIQQEADIQNAKKEAAKSEDPCSFLFHTRFWSETFSSVVESVMVAIFQLQYPVIVPTYVRDMEITTATRNLERCTERLRRALNALAELSLVTHHEATDSYSMHPLVHEWVRRRPDLKIKEQAVWCEVARQTISRSIVLPPLGYLVDHDMNLIRRLLPHVIALTEFQREVDRDLVRKRANRKWPWPAPLQLPMSPWTAMFRAKCSFVYFECGQLGKAEDCLKEVLEFNRTHLGETHARTQKVIMALREVLWHQGRVNDAAELIEQTLQSFLQALGQDHKETLLMKRLLGELRRHQGRFAESIELLTQAKTGFETQLPDSDPETYQALWELGTVLRYCYCFEEALECHERAVACLKPCLGETNVLTLFAREELAITNESLSTVHKVSNPELSRRYLETAKTHATFVLEHRIQQIGDKPLATRNAQGLLARINATMGEYDEAEQLYSTLVPMVTQSLGTDHIGLLTHQTAYAKMLMLRGRHDKAETVLQEVAKPEKWKTIRRVGDNPDRWDAVWTLARCYEEQGKTDRALAVVNDLLEAIGGIREGRKQTETSSVFWNTVLRKKEELGALGGSGNGGGSVIGAQRFPSETQGFTVPRPDVQDAGTAMSSVETPGSGDLRLRGSTQPRARPV